MRKLIYYVATSLDGFIAGPNESIDQFAMGGPGVEQYLQDLQSFDTVIMGRKTYEFGYQYGLQAGQPAYPHMRHYLFSDSLEFENPHEQVQVVGRDLAKVNELKAESGTDIYLCGGGTFAGYLLEHQLIDVLKLKLNPIVLGAGTPLFGAISSKSKLHLTNSQVYEDGLIMLTYDIQYPN